MALFYLSRPRRSPPWTSGQAAGRSPIPLREINLGGVGTARRRAAWLLVVFALLLLLPSSELHRFSGLPLNTPHEFFACMVLLPFLLGRGLRRMLARTLTDRRCAVLLLGVGAGAVILKAVILVGGPPGGFLACYTSPLAPPPGGGCERSYDNPFARFGATRVDRALEFTPERWNLSFLNALRVVVAQGIDGSEVLRSRYPFEARWRGPIAADSARVVSVSYVGEGTLTFGDAAIPIRLGPSYDRVGTVTAEIPAGRQMLEVVYRFDDGSRNASTLGAGPPASLVIAAARDDSGSLPLALPLAIESPASRWVVQGVTIDLAVTTLALVLVLVLARAMWSDRWLALTAVVGAFGIVVSADTALGRYAAVMVAICGLFLLCLLGRRSRRATMPFFVLLLLAGVRLFVDGSTWNLVFHRGFDNDWLTYESLGRSILESWSLRGGADVFYYQPLVRYVTFASHVVFGDTDVPIVVLTTALVNFGVCVLALSIRPRIRRPWATLMVSLSGLGVILVLNGQSVANLVTQGASEYPTWIWFPLALALLTRPRGRRWHLTGALLVGLSLVARFNQAIGLGLLLVVGTSAWPARRRVAAAFTVGIIAVLPVVHNWYYGGSPTILVGGLQHSLDIVNTQALPPVSLGDFAGRSESWNALWDHARVVAVVGQDLDDLPTFEIGVRLLQLLWVASLVVVPRLTGIGSMATWLLVVPVAYLGPHLFYQVSVYYPRHVVIGYLAMGCTVMHAVARAARPARSAVRFTGGLQSSEERPKRQHPERGGDDGGGDAA